MHHLKIPVKGIVFLLFIAGLFIGIKLSGADKVLTFENLVKNREVLRSYVNAHYLRSVFLYMLFFISTAFFMPGALVLTVVGGFLFGSLGGAFYAFFGSLAGASLAFTCSRHSLGKWIQRRYVLYLRKFNSEMTRNGERFLILLRVVPLFPFFLVNFLAGMTNISFRAFFRTTAIGILPGALIYAYSGYALGNIRSSADLYSPPVLASGLAISVLILATAVFTHIKRKRSEN